jgi:N-acetylmuramoyl-L-alanine amidase
LFRGDDIVAVIRYKPEEVQLLARLMRAEAEEDGTTGMLLVGNVGVNRVRVRCLDFKDISTITKMVFQRPGGFEATQRPYFYQRARDRDVRLAQQVIDGRRLDPGTNALWFYRPVGNCPAKWFGQASSGRYKAHCFFIPTPASCPEVY